MRLEVANIKRFWCLLSVACLSALFTAGAQELNCTVEVNADQIQNSSKEVFETLEQAIAEYVNTNKWTNAQFAANEKIECRMFFTIKSYDGDKMTGELQVQSLRPVYNSSYTTTVLNFRDTNVEFTYIENEPLVYSEMSMESNLTAIINFYCFVIINHCREKIFVVLIQKPDCIVQCRTFGFQFKSFCIIFHGMLKITKFGISITKIHVYRKAF